MYLRHARSLFFEKRYDMIKKKKTGLNPAEKKE